VTGVDTITSGTSCYVLHLDVSVHCLFSVGWFTVSMVINLSRTGTGFLEVCSDTSNSYLNIALFVK